MDYNILIGKRKDSEVFYVQEVNSIYVKKKSSAESIYLTCYFKKCNVKGLIKKDKKFHAFENDLHSNHDASINSLLAKFEFFGELRKNCSSFAKSLKTIVERIYLV